MNVVEANLEQVARIIAPRAWFQYDRALQPYLENRGGRDGEHYYYEWTWKQGCRTPEDYRRWWETCEHPVMELDIIFWRESQDKARAILEMLF